MQIFVNQMSPIICRWKLVKQIWWNIVIVLETIQEQKISERSSYVVLKRVAWFLISCSISHKFPALKRWNEKSEA